MESNITAIIGRRQEAEAFEFAHALGIRTFSEGEPL